MCGTQLHGEIGLQNVARVRNPIARRICMELIRAAPACPYNVWRCNALEIWAARRMYFRGPVRRRDWEFRNANNRQTCGPPSALYNGTSRYPRAPGARNLLSMFATHRRDLLKWPGDYGSKLNR